MRRNVAAIFAGLVVATTGGCVTVPVSSDTVDQEAKTFVPPTGKGSLYIYRPSNMFSWNTLFPVSINGLSAGQTMPDSYALLNLAPGTYVIESTAPESTAHLEVTIEAGKNVFIWQEGLQGAIRGPKIELHRADENTGRRAVMEFKRISNPVPDSRFSPLSATTTQPSPNELAATRLREITKLREEKLISEEEFQERRRLLINQL